MPLAEVSLAALIMVVCGCYGSKHQEGAQTGLGGSEGWGYA